jgi:RNA polymerase sigma-70 factor (sigma-E family)
MSGEVVVEAPAGFEDFVRVQSRSLLRTAWLLTGDWASAEDIVQTALAASWMRWSSITRRDAPEVYVRRVIVTTFLKANRRRWLGEVPTEQVPDSAAADEYERSDARASMLRALDLLAPRQRAVLALRYIDDLSERDTAAALNCSIGTVKSDAARGIARLRATSIVTQLLGEEVSE